MSVEHLLSPLHLHTCKFLLYMCVNSNYSCRAPLLITERSLSPCIRPSLLSTPSTLLLHHSPAFSTHNISFHSHLHVDDKLGDHPKNISSTGLVSLYLFNSSEVHYLEDATCLSSSNHYEIDREQALGWHIGQAIFTARDEDG